MFLPPPPPMTKDTAAQGKIKQRLNISDVQLEVYEYYKDFILEHQRSPSYREAAIALKKDVSNMHYFVKCLEAKGLLQRVGGNYGVAVVEFQDEEKRQLLTKIQSLEAQCSTLQSENEKLQFKYDSIREWAAERDKEKDENIATLQKENDLLKDTLHDYAESCAMSSHRPHCYCLPAIETLASLLPSHSSSSK